MRRNAQTRTYRYFRVILRNFLLPKRGAIMRKFTTHRHKQTIKFCGVNGRGSKSSGNYYNIKTVKKYKRQDKKRMRNLKIKRAN